LGTGCNEGLRETASLVKEQAMHLDDGDPFPSFTLHKALVETRRRCDGDGPSYQWAHRRVLSGELPAEKIGSEWRLPPEAVDLLTTLWRRFRHPA
jgi:hypothetical protein